MQNRLKLDFSLETAEERKNFINEYITQFVDLTPYELETIANYLLWGKTPDGIPLGKETQLETRWSKSGVPEIDSLEELAELPNYTDSKIHSLTDAVQYRVPRVTFDRKKTRQTCPPSLLPVFEDLWKQIDQIDLTINYYELLHNRRTKPPRETLLKRFTPEEQVALKKKASSLNQFTYLKLRHELIELRSQQFTIQDSYTITLNPVNVGGQVHGKDAHLIFDIDIPVLPLGLYTNKSIFAHFWEDGFDPTTLSEDELWKISDFLQRKRVEGRTSKYRVDFRELEAVYQLYLFNEELNDQLLLNLENQELDNNIQQIFATLEFYEKLAELNEIQLKVLELKKKRTKNQEIADEVNATFGKGYTANYISTIFRQKIIKKINEAAAFHAETVENWFYPENFKRCECCGRTLLLHERNWFRKVKSKDGFQSRCKKCEKEKRGR